MNKDIIICIHLIDKYLRNIPKTQIYHVKLIEVSNVCRLRACSHILSILGVLDTDFALVTAVLYSSYANYHISYNG